ncbi:MAG: permease [Crocinitomicaceae bacterium]|nr:permease [Crocinitomicaceae bacterium]
MKAFLVKWSDAAYTSLGFFWMALWAFILGYFLSSFIQVFISRQQMQQNMGGKNFRSVLLGTVFGFLSSSCSFSALATTKSLFKKGASFIASVAFLLASTNLVIELGIVISIFLGWQFVVAEYFGGILLIAVSWIIVLIIRPKKLIQKARENLSKEQDDQEQAQQEILTKLQSEEKWAKVSKQFGMEWKMVWKDITLGFTIAGIIAAFVPDSFFQSLFINTGNPTNEASFGTVLEHVLVGPLAAFMTFIGSMGNIPLAGLLFGKGVSFAGVMAFIFSDLVVFPVLRINAKYYGWKMSLFILFMLFTALIVASIALHYSFDWIGILPDPQNMVTAEKSYFQVDYTLFMNLAFILLSGYLVYLGFFKRKDVKHHKEMAPKSKLLESILGKISLACYLWLLIGISMKYIL